MPTDFYRAMKHCTFLSLLWAVVGVLVCVVFGWRNPSLLWRAYLLGLMATWPVALSGTGLLALGNLTGGRWALAARPFYLAAARTIPLVTLLLVPPAFALEQLYPWASPSNALTDHFSPGKAFYLSPQFFLARAAFYLFIWNVVAWWLVRVSRLDLEPASTPAMRRAGAVSLLLLVPTTTFAAFDGGMSLEPLWYSSIYGAILTAGGVVVAHAIAILGLARAPKETCAAIVFSADDLEPGDEQLLDVYNDLGNLLLAFIMLWTYFSFAQFFIIWSANLPGEVEWYIRRLSGGWQWLALTFVVLGFAIPFLMLLSRDVKRVPRRLATVAMLVLVAYALNLYWTIMPAFGPGNLASHATNAGSLVGLFSFWQTMYWWLVGRSIAHAWPDDNMQPQQ